ncbi:MAG: radical SAM family heme chaperone HemW [Hespellia sp.]|nr:radical SAM family heme chaperone HemW [Hespellia sp.]
MTNKIKNQNLQLYLHIPFCVRKCAYCDFLSGPAGAEEIERYVAAMMEEIRSYRQQYAGYEVSTVFLGGGTPSILTEVQMEGVFSALRETFRIHEDAEISIEMNPGTVTREKLRCYRKAGINRLSIGLQSVNNEELKLLGRIHTMEDFLSTYRMAREEKFTNINIDLISAIPGQTTESWLHTLKTVADLEPEHISAYSLIVEEGTPFFKQYGEKEETSVLQSSDIPKLPDEEDERIIYKDTEKFLKERKYERYEISNYAKPGYECRHNLGYWQRENYLGIGLGAASMIENRRFTHLTDRAKYVELIEKNQFKQLIEEQENLTLQAQMEEFMFLGLREMKGISKEKFAEVFGKQIESVYGEILRTLRNEHLIVDEKNFIRLTEYGIDISNYVMSQFLIS